MTVDHVFYANGSGSSRSRGLWRPVAQYTQDLGRDCIRVQPQRRHVNISAHKGSICPLLKELRPVRGYSS